MKFLGHDISALGMGCWPIGGEMFFGDQSLGYAGADDATSIKTIHAALAGGISLFDTAAAYGAGHSERLLAKALKNRPDALVVTKIGHGIDEQSKQISFGKFSPDMVQQSIEDCLRRLARDRIDVLLLHVNDMEVSKAEAIFDEFEKARSAGKIRAYGWSTDISQSVATMAARKGFRVIEHVMNVFFDARRIQNTVRECGLHSLIRSPLAMGLLSGKYNATTVVPARDVRASREDWMEYFKDGRANPELAKTLDTVRDLLQTDGRTMVQGALGWLWAKSETNIPIPGARTVEQIEDIAASLEFGALPAAVIAKIETLVERHPDESDRPR
ncbi:MAG: aldo/keto reductase [Pseudomonadota bacterium]